MVSVARIMFLSLFVCLIWINLGCQQQANRPDIVEPKNVVVIGMVELEIEFNSDRENILCSVPCSADSTVYEVLEVARSQGDLDFSSTGQVAEMRFVKSIGGVENLAAAGDNWVYRVNGKLGDKSSGLFSVSPGDRVVWAFGKYPK